MNNSRDLNNTAYSSFKELENSVLIKLPNVKREEILKNLKIHFQNKINSKRTFDRIHNFEDLFKVLKKRNHLCHTIEPMTLNIINDMQLCQNRNYFQNEHKISKTNTNTDEFFYNQVIQGISERIGNKWRHLARYLGFKEMEIDEIEAKFNTDSKEKAYQILRISQSKLNSENWKIELIFALERVRRKDLREWVEANFENAKKPS